MGHVRQAVVSPRFGERLRADSGRLTPQVTLLRERLAAEADAPWLIVFGTGWGLETGFLERESDYLLEPIPGRGDYNHLSVRSAAGMILDRLLSVDRKDD